MPENYHFIQPGESYQMDALSWRRLTLVREGQEVTELVVMLVVLRLVLSTKEKSPTWLRLSQIGDK